MKRFIVKIGQVVLGGIIQGFGMGLFLFPNAIPSGGAGGIAILLNHLFLLDISVSLWIVNFFMLLTGVKELGKRFALWTIVGMTMTSLSVHFFEHNIVIVHRNLFYDLILGSVFLGTGIGILMRQGVSNGGAGVVAFVIALRRNILPGKPLFIINGVIFIMTSIIINWKIVFLALMSQWISTRVIDFIYVR
ncbi:MAG TPA: YitT family protein [Bacillota bacterium]|nr:YitT family protein [Bacillota bacterium]